MSNKKFLYVLHVSNSANGITLKLMSKAAFCRRYGITQDYDSWHNDFNSLQDVHETENREVMGDIIDALFDCKVIDVNEYRTLNKTLSLLP